ncbi:hypothetical protein [Streptomyces sp. NPDC007205]|uniref:hypothetical protein n=1 Tax=Streptomyces sp. NPDC007205 TaxID=3154316 RepID=UPI00340430AC
MNSKRVAGTVAAAALLSGLVVAPAQAASSNVATPTACTVIDIGLPAKITVGNVYVGEVEQQYDNCHNVRVHFQWSSAYRAAHPNAQVDGTPFGWNHSTNFGGWQTARQSQDYWSPWTWIYHNNEDTWRADAQIYTDANPVTWCGIAWGDWHRYTDGAEFGGVSDANC